MAHLHIERLVMVLLVLCVNRVAILATAEPKYPALFAFGDSILDTGNNNKIFTIIKANYRPYGLIYNGGKPTGRFSDGKNPSDLIASALGIKDALPPYYKNKDLDPKELPTGVCFASGGAGYDNKTSGFVRVLSLYDQLNLFKEYKGKLIESVGQQKADEIVSKSLHIISAANNDIAITYTRAARPMPYPEYANLLVEWTSTFLKDLYALGARHVWVFSALPLGCLPVARASVGGKKCNDLENGFALQFNGILEQNITSLRKATPDYDVQFVDVFSMLHNVVDNYTQLGYEDPANCCGGKRLGLGLLCSGMTGKCKNSSSHVFWDFAHPTQRTYEIVVSEIIKKHAPI